MKPFRKPSYLFHENPLQYFTKYSILLICLFASTLLMQADEATEPPDTIKSFKVKQAYKAYQDEIKKANEIIEKATQKYKEELEKEQIAVMKQGKADEYEAIKAYAEKEFPATDDKKEVADGAKEIKPGGVLEDIHEGDAGNAHKNVDYKLKLRGIANSQTILVIDATPRGGSLISRGEISLNDEVLSKWDFKSNNSTPIEIDITKYLSKGFKDFKVSFKYSGGGSSLFIKSVKAKYVNQ